MKEKIAEFLSKVVGALFLIVIVIIFVRLVCFGFGFKFHWRLICGTLGLMALIVLTLRLGINN